MRFIYGTGNQAKLQFMKDTLSTLPLEIVGMQTVLDAIPNIDESGNDPLENAIIKATAYYDMLRVPVFSCDSGLFIEELDESLQPGVHVRNMNGKYLTDDEMLQYYSSIAKKCGGACHAVYRNAICLIYDEHHTYKYMGDDISGESFLISCTPHSRRRAGFPLDSLSVHIDSGKYYFDLDEECASSTAPGFQNFFRSVLHQLNQF